MVSYGLVNYIRQLPDPRYRMKGNSSNLIGIRVPFAKTISTGHIHKLHLRGRGARNLYLYKEFFQQSRFNVFVSVRDTVGFSL